MGIRVALTHCTSYRYTRAVSLGPQVVRLRPAPHCRTIVESYALAISPAEHFLNWQQDAFGNHQARSLHPHPVRELRVDVRLVLDLEVVNPFDFFLEPVAERIPFAYPPEVARDLGPYLEAGEAGPLVAALLERAPKAGTTTVDYLVELNRLVLSAVDYVVRLDPGVQEPEQTLELRSGSCRDSAWLLVTMARKLGLAARFVSGYLVQLAPDPDATGKIDGPPADFCDLHAWTEIYLPGAGWIGLDATSGLLAGEGHIPLAGTPFPASASPVSGGYAPIGASGEDSERGEDDEETGSTMSVEMTVSRLETAPRTTKPYSTESWHDILAAGDRIDEVLAAEDVRLTMGGEPTFVSAGGRDEPEWTTAALGGDKREFAESLVKRLQARIAAGGLLHYGQGKWYPGEPLPRWALGCYWREDGQPVWRDPDLIADRAAPVGSGAADAERLVRELTSRLGIDVGFALPAYEDAFYHLWREHRLPVGMDPRDPRMDDPQERARLARIFANGLGAIVGYALPIAVRHDGGWASAPWTMRSELLLLVPGDSPMGYRLPLDALPWLTAEQRAALEDPQRDPLAARPPLPPRIVQVRNALASLPSPEPVRTALCIEPRDGVLNVFMPPVAHLERYLELVAAIEDSAATIGIPVAIEGYHPPRDHRLLHFAVTPDPGVIEVNVQPQSSWRGAVEATESLYADAASCGLTAERFLVDGRHCGTGGGNHVTLGAASPIDSPFLRRPSLLRSMIAYWHNHPSLSYLFCGLFAGPTSQAPRADEARTETVYELETALDQLPDDGPCPPWLVDRVLRHLLIDLTGNTHRAEFCIDKLFSPDSATGRLGLLELRGFEMPPHARLSASEQLLVRALVARFWREPYRAPLARWGTGLHDRFMLPAVLWEDFRDVARELRERGLPVEDAWFAPHRDFRFAPIGSINHRGIRLELTQALEPWHVLGEEPGAGGTVRYVDSSVERVQVVLAGLADDRHQIACNGVRLPLHDLGAGGSAVCGVRYRAWRPPNGLHPTIPVHAPLVFDIVDSWIGRSVAGCTYHVSHPGGRTYEHPPVNAAEAEARRAGRFDDRGWSPRLRTLAAPAIDRDYPFTLDLRRTKASAPATSPAVSVIAARAVAGAGSR